MKCTACINTTYWVKRVTVGEDKLNVCNKLLHTLVMVEVRFAQTTAHSPQVHRIRYDLVVVRNLANTNKLQSVKDILQKVMRVSKNTHTHSRLTAFFPGLPG